MDIRINIHCRQYPLIELKFQVDHWLSMLLIFPLLALSLLDLSVISQPSLTCTLIISIRASIFRPLYHV
jgi:hypothetical protein